MAQQVFSLEVNKDIGDVLQWSTSVQFPALVSDYSFMLMQTLKGSGDNSNNWAPATQNGDLDWPQLWPALEAWTNKREHSLFTSQINQYDLQPKKGCSDIKINARLQKERFCSDGLLCEGFERISKIRAFGIEFACGPVVAGDDVTIVPAVFTKGSLKCHHLHPPLTCPTNPCTNTKETKAGTETSL